jgi:hypothetical protein
VITFLALYFCIVFFAAFLWAAAFSGSVHEAKRMRQGIPLALVWPLAGLVAVVWLLWEWNREYRRNNGPERRRRNQEALLRAQHIRTSHRQVTSVI